MPELHAPDAMGEAAHYAAATVGRFELRLLAAASPRLNRAERAEQLRLALTQWPVICRAMSELQALAPASRMAADAADAELMDFVERRDAPATEPDASGAAG